MRTAAAVSAADRPRLGRADDKCVCSFTNELRSWGSGVIRGHLTRDISRRHILLPGVQFSEVCLGVRLSYCPLKTTNYRLEN